MKIPYSLFFISYVEYITFIDFHVVYLSLYIYFIEQLFCEGIPLV